MERFKDNLPIIFFENQASWHDWLHSHREEELGLWLKISKKCSEITSVSYQEALDEALCFGWIDGQKQVYDDKFYLQRFTPRRPRSIWSKVNVAKVADLIASGRMQPSGFAAVEAAKADGRWDAAYDSQASIEMTSELQAALELSPVAKAFFEGLNKSNRYAILWRIQNAKKAETRQANIKKYITMLEAGETFH